MSNSGGLFQLQREVGKAGGSEASNEAKERFKLRVTGLGSLGLKDSIAGGFREMAGSGDKSGGGGRLSVARPAAMARERVVGEARWTVPTAGDLRKGEMEGRVVLAKEGRLEQGV